MSQLYDRLPSKEVKLDLMYGHEGIYYIRDIRYIIRMIKKISKTLPKYKRDIDWIQNLIESFLIMNSRFYNDLIIDLVNEVKRYQLFPETYSLKYTLKKYDSTLSSKYHQKRQLNRHRAAHGSNYQRVGISEFHNDVLPKPMSYQPTMELFNMAKINDLIKMWQTDMEQCSNDISTIFKEVIDELNTYKDMPQINPYTDKVKLKKEPKD